MLTDSAQQLLADKAATFLGSDLNVTSNDVRRAGVERGGTCLVASHEARVADAADRVLDLDTR